MKLVKNLIAVIIMVIFVAACTKFTGGGWIFGQYGGKANFGFTAQCVDLEPGVEVKGQFQYKDRSADVQFHGRFENYWGSNFESCEDVLIQYAGMEHTIDIEGTCWTQPGRVEGYFEVIATDNDEDSYPDNIQIVTNCTPTGEYYMHMGDVHGGNIKSHD